MGTRKLFWDNASELGSKNLAPGLVYKSKENKSFFFLSSYKEALGARLVKRIFDKKCALNQGKKKLFLEEVVFFIKDKNVISAKFPVNISRRYVMYVMFYHYTGNLWNSAAFASFRHFRNCQLRESNPCHFGANSTDLATMICIFVILISCSNPIPNSRPFF